MIKGTMLNAAEYKYRIKPFFEILHWEAETIAVPPYGEIIVHSVTRSRIGGGREPVSENMVDEVMDGCLSGTYAAPEQKELKPLEKLPPINIYVLAETYLKYLQPHFDWLNWRVKYEPNESGGVVITGATDDQHHLVDGDLVLSAVREALPGIEQPGIQPKEKPDRSSAPDEDLKTSDGAIDYTDILKRPENAENLKVYAKMALTIHRDPLTDIVRPAFESRGWIYGGNHYGDGLVEVQSVLDKEEHVVSLDEVLRVLASLGVEYTSQPPDMDLETDEDLGAEIGERSPLEFDQDVLDRQDAAEAAMKEEESETDGVLILQERDSLGVKAEYSSETDRVTVDFNIGENVITVECSTEQFDGFVHRVYRLWPDSPPAKRLYPKEPEPDE